MWGVCEILPDGSNSGELIIDTISQFLEASSSVFINLSEQND